MGRDKTRLPRGQHPKKLEASVPQEEFDRVKREAKAEGISVSFFLVRAIRFFLRFRSEHPDWKPGEKD